MRITLATHGGLAALIRAQEPPRALVTDTLPGSAATELRRLVDAAAPAAERNEEPDDGATRATEADRARDATSRTITVEEGGRCRVLVQSDAARSPEFAALARWLREHRARW